MPLRQRGEGEGDGGGTAKFGQYSIRGRCRKGKKRPVILLARKSSVSVAAAARASERSDRGQQRHKMPNRTSDVRATGTVKWQ